MLFTLGPLGAFAMTNDEPTLRRTLGRIEHGLLPSHVSRRAAFKADGAIDTVGAGDAFLAGAVASLLSGGDLDRVLDVGKWPYGPLARRRRPRGDQSCQETGAPRPATTVPRLAQPPRRAELAKLEAGFTGSTAHKPFASVWRLSWFIDHRGADRGAGHHPSATRVTGLCVISKAVTDARLNQDHWCSAAIMSSDTPLTSRASRPRRRRRVKRASASRAAVLSTSTLAKLLRSMRLEDECAARARVLPGQISGRSRRRRFANILRQHVLRPSNGIALAVVPGIFAAGDEAPPPRNDPANRQRSAPLPDTRSMQRFKFGRPRTSSRGWLLFHQTRSGGKSAAD